MVSRKQRIEYLVEPLEPRTLLSAVAVSVLAPAPLEIISPAASRVAPPFTPSDIQNAFGLNDVSFNGVPGDGRGQTIAVIVAYNDPNLLSDAAEFSSYYGLQAFNVSGGPKLKVENQSGQTTNLPTNASLFSTWAGESVLDVEWAHVVAPMASITVYEANSDNYTDLIAAITTAEDANGVSVVSMSFDGSEFSTETQYDSTFTTPLGHQGVTFIACSGDDGSPSGFPAVSPNVLSVGGTSLTLLSNGTYTETGWTDSGGGVSQYEPLPGYQSGKINGDSGSNRTVPDVSWIADPNTGVWVYDTYSSNGWTEIGGTSLSCPMVAGLFAVIDQGRVARGQATLDGPTQALPMLYKLPASDFYDITSGNNGLAAGPGYDMVTGLGSPIVPALVYDMAGFPHSLQIQKQPGTVVAGATWSPAVVVRILDAFGNVVTSDQSNVTLSIASGPSGGALIGTATVAAVNGIATFSAITLDIAGVYQLSATDSEGASGGFSIAAATSSAITVTFAAPAQLSFTSEPGDVTAGAANQTVRVDVLDAFGNLVANNSSTVTMSIKSGPAGAALEGINSVSAQSGVANFTDIVLFLAGAYTLRASDGSTTPHGSTSFTVSPAAAFKAKFIVQPVNVVAGNQISPAVVVEVSDPYGNLIDNATPNVTISVFSGPSTAISGTLKIKAAAGEATFSDLSLNIAGTYVLQAVANGLSARSSAEFVVTPAAAAQLIWGLEPINAVAGTVMPPVTVKVADQFGNRVTTDDSAITLGIDTGPDGASLLGTLMESAQSGKANFSGLLLTMAGAYTLVATDGSFAAGTSQAFSITPAAPAQLSFVQQPVNTVAGQTIAPAITVFALDAFGNAADGYKLDLSIAAGPASGVLIGKAAAKVTGGVATFDNVQFQIAGVYTLTVASAPGLPNASATSSEFNIVPAAAVKLRVPTEPTSVVAGSDISPAIIVKAKDMFGNLVDGAAVTLSITAGPSGATLNGTTTQITTGGKATFSDISLTTAGVYALQAAAGSLTTVAASDLTVTHAHAAQLAFTREPANVVAGAVMAPPIKDAVEDIFGNICNTNASSITLIISSQSGDGTLGGTNEVSAVAGVAKFNNLTLSQSGTYILEATDGSLASAMSLSITVS